MQLAAAFQRMGLAAQRQALGLQARRSRADRVLLDRAVMIIGVYLFHSINSVGTDVSKDAQAWPN